MLFFCVPETQGQKLSSPVSMTTYLSGLLVKIDFSGLRFKVSVSQYHRDYFKFVMIMYEASFQTNKQNRNYLIRNRGLFHHLTKKLEPDRTTNFIYWTTLL